MKRIVLILISCMVLVSTTTAQQTKKTSAKTKTSTTLRKSSVTSRKTVSNKKTSAKKSTQTKKIAKPKETISSLTNRRNTVKKELDRNQANLAKTNRDVKRQLSDLAVLNGKIDKQQRYIGEIQDQLDSLSSQIITQTREYDKLSRQLEERRQKFRKSMLYLFKNNNQENKLLFILSADNFSQMFRRYRLVKEYGKYQQKQGELIKRKQKQVNEIKFQLQKTKDSKDQMLSVQKIEREIRNVIEANKKEMAALDAKIDYYVKLAIEQERKRREAEERARKEAERKAALASASPSGTGSAKNNTSSKSRVAKTEPEPMPQWRSNTKEYTLSQNFSSNKGRLPMPITGSYVISAHYGNYSMSGMKGVQLNNKGINITGQPGAKARCIFPGEVSAVFSLGGLVNVLVRHGSYISVYCNLSSATVTHGQHVDARAILGSVARDASGRCTLHFQLRKETATLNPESWLAR